MSPPRVWWPTSPPGRGAPRRRRRLAAALLCAPPLLVGCGSEEPTGTLTVEGAVSVCPQSGDCADLPAAGAAVSVHDAAGNQVETGTLDAGGRFVVEVPAGDYSAALSLPALGLRTTEESMTVQVSEGGAGDLSIRLPAVHVRR